MLVSVSSRWRYLQQKASKKWRHFTLFQVTEMMGLVNCLAFPCRRGWRWRHSFQVATGQGFLQELHEQAGITSDQGLRVPSTVVDHTCTSWLTLLGGKSQPLSLERHFLGQQLLKHLLQPCSAKLFSLSHSVLQHHALWYKDAKNVFGKTTYPIRDNHI